MFLWYSLRLVWLWQVIQLQSATNRFLQPSIFWKPWNVLNNTQSRVHSVDVGFNLDDQEWVCYQFTKQIPLDIWISLIWTPMTAVCRLILVNFLPCVYRVPSIYLQWVHSNTFDDCLFFLQDSFVQDTHNHVVLLCVYFCFCVLCFTWAWVWKWCSGAAQQWISQFSVVTWFNIWRRYIADLSHAT